MPSIFFWLSDNHATSTMKAYDGRYAQIDICPRLDELSEHARIFQNAFCTNPGRTQVGSAFLTGIVNCGSGTKKISKFLPLELKQKGYETILFGAWDWEISPSKVGFDKWLILSDNELIFNPELNDGKNYRRYEGHVIDVLTDLSLDWMRSEKLSKKPFFLMLSMPGTQRPWMPPIRLLDKFDNEWLQPPSTFHDDFESKIPANKYQTMNVQSDLCSSGDLFQNLEQNEINSTKQVLLLQRNLASMNNEQSSAWSLGWKSKNEAFLRETQTSEALNGWKYQRFVKNYFRCLKAQDENLGRIIDFLNDQMVPGQKQLIYSAQRGRFLGEFGWFGCDWAYEPSLRIPLLFAARGVALLRMLAS